MKIEKNHSVINGDRIFLREVELADVNQTYIQWMNDPEVTQYLESRFFPQSMESISAFVKHQIEDPHVAFLAICLNENKLHIGNIKLGPVDVIHRFADVGLVVGDKKFWGKGYGNEAIGLVVKYAFQTLNLNKLVANCYQLNKGAIKAFRKNGFEIEGVWSKHHFCKGKYIDTVLLGILNPNRNDSDEDKID
ncbi:MAG: GNAT family N-acetyltransferase [Proteobacteria bacterium]|nr:GNAT family N-acetyltransferase [Pseudomonadota bacterium]